MSHNFSLDQDKVSSLVFRFTDQLGQNSPEPDFQKWMDSALDTDLGTSEDAAEYEKHSLKVCEAWRLFHASIEATGALLGLYKDNPPLFQKIASQLSFLPCLMSWHPDSERFNHRLFKFSKNGQKCIYGDLTNNPHHLIQQSWPVRYAYTIIDTVDLTLGCYGDELPIWAALYGHGVKHPIPLDAYKEAMQRMCWDDAKQRQELPKYQNSHLILPKWTKNLEKIRRPFNTRHVLDYWRTGKQIILEEMPDFQDRPEWASYRRRKYKSGAKPGAIQHAIFKDILTALKTIAGAKRQKTGAVRAKSAGAQS